MVNSDAPGSEDGHSDPIDPIDPEIENAVNYVISNEAQILLDMLPSRSSNLWDNADDYEDYLNAEVDDADDDDELTMGEDEEYLNAEVDIGEDDDEITIGDDEGEDEDEYDDDDDAELWGNLIFYLPRSLLALIENQELTSGRGRKRKYAVFKPRWG